MCKDNFIGIATDELYRIFNILNDKYFESKLEHPMITIQKSRPSNLGWFTVNKVWTNKDKENLRYEINLSAGHLADNINDVVGTLLHEMVHYANAVSGIRDCNGQVHNKKFKTAAELVDLIVEKTQRYGYGFTSCSDALNEFINNTIKPNQDCFMYFRDDSAVTKPEKEKTIFTYVCPGCGEKVHAKRDKDIICGTCNVTFEMQE